MTSYAAAAAAPAPHMNGVHKRSLTSDLFSPPTETFTLAAALFLLEPPKESVFLMPRGYLENWVRWASQQTVPTHEKDRVRKAFKLIAEAYEFDLDNPDYADPGPIDNRELSIPGHPLLLRPEVEVGETQSVLNQTPLRRVLSFNAITTTTSTNGHANPSDKEESEEASDKVKCCVVPERFYEVRNQLLSCF